MFGDTALFGYRKGFRGCRLARWVGLGDAKWLDRGVLGDVDWLDGGSRLAKWKRRTWRQSNKVAESPPGVDEGGLRLGQGSAGESWRRPDNTGLVRRPGQRDRTQRVLQVSR